MTDGPNKIEWPEDEIGRFQNEHGERYVLFKDNTFTGDEVDWERVPLVGDFIFSKEELSTALAIIAAARPISERVR